MFNFLYIVAMRINSTFLRARTFTNDILIFPFPHKYKSPKELTFFFPLFFCSMLFGNFFVYLAFRGKANIGEHDRFLVSTVLSVVCGVGCILMNLIRPALSTSGHVLPQRSVGPVQAFVEAITLIGRREMALLCLTFFYTGKFFIPHKSTWTFCVNLN